MRLHRAAWAVGVGVALSMSSGCAARRAPGSDPTKIDARGSLWLPLAGSPGYWSPSALKGRVTLVNFFATWCFPCLGQLPLLGQLQTELGPSGLQVVGIGMDLEGAKLLDPFARQEPQHFPLLVADDSIRNGETPFGHIPILPATFLLDREGHITRAWPGLPDPKQLRDEVESALRSGR
jgi:thiol-disulfide isomerase/thioredoxin